MALNVIWLLPQHVSFSGLHMSYVPLERHQRCFRDIQASYKLGIKSGSYKKKLNAKDYFPARLVYVYAGGRGPFDLMVTGSGGKTSNGD